MHHTAHRKYVAAMHIGSAAQLAFHFGGFFGQDVAFESLATFDRAAWADTEALFCGAFGLHFWHNNICPFGQLHFYMIAGGNITLLLDACTHLYYDRI